MRYVFISLVLLNICLLMWRFAFGLPQHLLRAAEPVVFDVRQIFSEGVAKLVLLSENPVFAEPRSLTEVPPLLGKLIEPILESKKDSPLGAVVSKRVMPLCKSVGPFVDAAQAEEFLSRVAQYRVSGQLQTLSVPVGASHWVLYPEGDEKLTASGVALALSARGVDTYVIPNGRLRGRVSLGVFRRVDQSLALQEELEVKGVDSEIVTINRTRDELWIELAAEDELKIEKKDWHSLTQEAFSLREQENFCLDVASNQNFH